MLLPSSLDVLVGGGGSSYSSELYTGRFRGEVETLGLGSPRSFSERLPGLAEKMMYKQ